MVADRRAIDVGVIGVGSMGQHHARVYAELPEANLVGVSDVDADRASEIAGKYGTVAMDRETVFRTADAVSIAVPTQYHYELLLQSLDAHVATFIEKPIVGDLERAPEIRKRVERADVPVQVGHIERFNPAVSTLQGIIQDLDVVSVRAHRLGPPPERTIDDSAVLDLMIHDIDVVLSLLDAEPVAIHSAGVDGNTHAAALLEFDGETMASLTASRKTQRKVRRLEVTAEECFIELDYMAQSIEIHRSSVPEYVESNGDVRFKHESIVERPQISNGEPLRKELASFVESVRNHRIPSVTVDDGLAALSIAHEIEQQALGTTKPELIADD